ATYSGDTNFLGRTGTVIQVVQYNFAFTQPFAPPKQPSAAPIQAGTGKTLRITFSVTDVATNRVAQSAVLPLRVLDSQGADVPGVSATLQNQGQKDYEFDWAVPQGFALGTYTILIGLDDGTAHTQPIEFAASKGNKKLVAAGTDTSTSAQDTGGLLAGDINLY